VTFVIRVFRLWLGILFSVYGIYLAINNTERVVIQLPPFIAQVSVPVYMAAVGFMLTGCFLAIVFLGLDLAKKSLTIHQLKKKLRQFESNPPADLPAVETASVGPVVD
jgi:uncharacterized integral membrane protein